MSVYNQEYNQDNVVLRYILVALLADLKNSVYIYNQIDEDTVKKIDIPFYYSVTGNERFLLDTFLFSAEENGKAIGDYELVPRGVALMSSLAIDSGSMTNKFVRAEFVKTIDSGELKTFNLETNFLPLTMTFDMTVVCSNNLEMLKVTESVISKLYKSNFYQVDLGMFRVEASYQVPEDYSQEKLFEFSIDDKKEFKVTFPIEVQSFIPVFEYGILLPEINELIEGNTDIGVGLYRNGAIRFGGIYQEFDTSINDIELSPDRSLESNKANSFNDTPSRGKVYSINELTSKAIDKESPGSKAWRNADDQEG
jgi:hypothetical protein